MVTKTLLRSVSSSMHEVREDIFFLLSSYTSHFLCSQARRQQLHLCSEHSFRLTMSTRRRDHAFSLHRLSVIEWPDANTPFSDCRLGHSLGPVACRSKSSAAEDEERPAVHTLQLSVQLDQTRVIEEVVFQFIHDHSFSIRRTDTDCCGTR